MENKLNLKKGDLFILYPPSDNRQVATKLICVFKELEGDIISVPVAVLTSDYDTFKDDKIMFDLTFNINKVKIYPSNNHHKFQFDYLLEKNNVRFYRTITKK